MASPFPARVAAAEAVGGLVRVAPRADDASAPTEGVGPQRRGRRGARPRRETASGVRELVVAEAGRRARSGWAWERELAFLLMESCAPEGPAEEGREGASDDGGQGVALAR